MDEGRFPPGTLLGQRYRIVSLLGRGGMGEVYRANDLLLGQTVALKFLPAAATANEAALSRFRNEVRTARQVSHPNVCRVYDIGEAEGLTYLTMEYVDGEDLASLLRRIGRLPQDKALEIARKVCAGLAAAHDKGVVHRDLKPANIMLDSQGQVRITDFGLAGMAEQLGDVRSGTPAYMAPEQRAGKQVSARSDIYALGVVLHEVFTGKRPSEEGSKPELDPAVERVIQRCLQEDPLKRPPTALAVAAALPGGDPLAAALAAGETPSPEVVANAGAVEGMPIRSALVCLAAVVVGLVALCFVRDKTDIINQIPLENPPEALAAKARDIARSLGYAERPFDRAFGWQYDWNHIRYLHEQKDAVSRSTRLRTNQPPAAVFWYRESPELLAAFEGPRVTRTDPAPGGAGMLEARLDPEGRLIEFHAQPLPVAKLTSQAPATDWSRLFAAAGLDFNRFTQAQPELAPTVFAETRAAWTGSSFGGLSDPLRVEAAACQGRPVFFKVIGPWSGPEQPESPQIPPSFGLVFLIVLPAAASLVAWRNTRLGRGDRRGAFRLACFAFLVQLPTFLLLSNHTATSTEVAVILRVLQRALFSPVFVWVLYMAFEPYLRRRSPEMLISWSRLLAGRFRDPLLGGDLLVGVVLGIWANLLTLLASLTGPLAATQGPPIRATQLTLGAGYSLAVCLQLVMFAAGGGLSFVFEWMLLRRLLRRPWLVVLVFALQYFVIFAPGPATAAALPVRVMVTVLNVGLLVYALARFGLVTTTLFIFAGAILSRFPLTANLSAWYAPSALVAVLIVLAIAVYAFHTTLAGRPLWRDELQEV
jgi:serine/threonine-protein kinase